MSKYYKPITWENKPTSVTLKQSDLVFRPMEDIISNMLEAEQPRKISYRCKNCNGHINPATMKCEYCDTQY